MKKETKIIIVILIVLLVGTVILYFLNKPNTMVSDDEMFVILVGEETYEVNQSVLDEIGMQDIAANYDSSNTDGEIRNFEGIAFQQLVEHFGIDTSTYSSVTFKAIDSYTSGVDMTKAMDPQQCVIVSHEEGEPLGDKESGGSGPFMMVLPQDQFSQQWCKYLAEVSFHE